MMIEDYSFGQMVIDGKEYSLDLIIYPDRRIQSPWHRGESHLLIQSDITELLASEPEVLIVGTGASGFMEIDGALIDLIKKKGIEIIAEPTRQANQRYNELSKTKKVGACFHLTC